MTSFYYTRFLQGFAFLRKLGLLLFKSQCVGLPNLDIKEKMKLIPLVAKTCHRVNSQLGPVAPVALQQFRRDPYVSQFFVFGLGSKLCLFIFSPVNNVRSSKNCKVAPYMKKSRPE